MSMCFGSALYIVHPWQGWVSSGVPGHPKVKLVRDLHEAGIFAESASLSKDPDDIWMRERKMQEFE